jgi:uncharacterized LabA/DUF88 family protein
VITEHTHAENNDWQEPGGEQSSASETSIQPSTTAVPPNAEEQAAGMEAGTQEALSAARAEDVVPEQQGTQEAQPSLSEQSSAESANASDAAVTEQSTPEENTSPVAEDEAIRPFTDFIEEFRQTEERLSALLSDAGTSSTVFTAGSEMIQEPVVFTETAAEDLTSVIDTMQSEAEQTLASPFEATPPALTPPERPVSPLLRPASRLRLPRHGRHRVEEHAQSVEQPKPQGEQPAAESAAPVEPQVEEQPARPARRYRFDRPAATASASLPTAKAAMPAAPASGTETKAKRDTSFTTKKEQHAQAEPTTARASASGVAQPETPVQKEKAPAQEATPASTEAATPTVTTPASERRRRGNHERQREKEKEQAAASAAAATAPVQEPIAPPVEPVPAAEAEIAVEDLPPLEYADLQAANSRRRRRRRVNGVSAPAVPTGTATPKVTPELPVNAPPPLALPKSASVSASTYNIVSGYTVSQMNQGNDASGPFMGPEPSPARGSTFGTSTSLRPMRNEALRSTPAHPVKHGGEANPMMSPASVNHLANIVSQAIQTQTDRMVAEMRRANQVPTNVSVSLPPFPSTERVGVFVDVANLLYSARTLRMTIDFGKLLDFLRGNRRLVRAQAYCPTSPQPGDDQMFLQAVKGLGYRITTKNYKTFSSGAKKADLDLDLCMDVVRLVDGNAVDCVVLVSGDSDFMPMLDYCSDHGVRVEVAAFDESMSATLRQACDLFVNLSMLEEIRA